MSSAFSLRRIFAATAIAVAALAVPTGANALGGANKSIELAASTEQRNLLDLGEPGLTLGDQIAFSNDLRARTSGKPAGIDGGNCTMIRIKDAAAQSGTVHCRVTYSLDGGQITTQGLLELTGGGFEGTQSAAITGGTGRFRHADGVATAHFVSPGAVEITLDLH